MRIEPASEKAIKYACMNFHYARAVPMHMVSFSVFNGENEWCGVVLFSHGANNNLAKSFSMVQGQVCELVRVALNGKQEKTSKVLAMCIKLLKKSAPLCKILVSYADPEQSHLGVLYQACNFIYAGTSTPQREVICPKTGKVLHKRIANARFGTIKGLEKSKVFFKHKYIYPLCKNVIPLCKQLAKPYPRKQHAAEALMDDVPGDQSGEGVRFDPAAQNSKKTAK